MAVEVWKNLLSLTNVTQTPYNVHTATSLSPFVCVLFLVAFAALYVL